MDTPHVDSVSRVPVLYATMAGSVQDTTKRTPDATTALPRVNRGAAVGAGGVLEGADVMFPPILPNGREDPAAHHAHPSRHDALMTQRPNLG